MKNKQEKWRQVANDRPPAGSRRLSFRINPIHRLHPSDNGNKDNDDQLFRV